MASVYYKHVFKKFDSLTVIKDFDLKIHDGEFVVFVGPSGCGKTTLLRLIAGLEEVTEGKLYIGDHAVNDVSPKQRNIAMVFQNYALYPHMTVAENIGFGLKLRGASKEEQKAAVDRAAKLLELKDFLDRRPRVLSGGQRQRVAMGRAIVRDPAVLLMDEPLSNLDAKLRAQMRVEIKQLQRRLATTTIYVTHDQIEAMTLSDRIAVINEGRLQQFGTPDELYTKPANSFVAGFIGSPAMNFLEAQRIADEVLELPNGLRVQLPAERASTLGEGETFEIGIRPEHIQIATNTNNDNGDTFVWQTRVNFSEALGGETVIHALLGDQQVKLKIADHHGPAEGSNVKLAFDVSRAHIFRGDAGHCVSTATRA